MFFTGGNLPIPIQPSLAVGAGYPLQAGPLTLDIGVRVSYSPIEYDVMNMSRFASLTGIRATIGATYRMDDKLGVHCDAGIGVAMLRGLENDNPFTNMGKAGAFTMFSFRIGVAAEYAVTSNVVATVAPLSLAFSPAPKGLVITSLSQLDVLVGLGYRM
jgi:opacity protein-like surface antigen